MDDAKKIYREGENKVREAGREFDGHDAGDDVGNLGDDIRKDLGNAGDDMRRTAKESQDEARKPATTPR